MKKEPTQQELLQADLITLGVVTNALSLELVEKISGFRKIYTRQLKHFGNKYLEELIKSEELLFYKVQDINEDRIHSQMDQIKDGIQFLAANGFVGAVLTNKFNKAYNYDPKRVMGIIDKIISDNE